MSLETIMTVATAVIAFIFGKLAKRFNWIESKYIPVQNLIIGIVVAVGYYLFVDNSNIANAIVLAFSGLISGGFYDLTKTEKESEE